MPLITCPDCQAEISDSAPSCPKCGRPREIKEPSSVSKKGQGEALLFQLIKYASVSAIFGFVLTWGSCLGFNIGSASDGWEVVSFAAGSFAVLGAVIGAVLYKK